MATGTNAIATEQEAKNKINPDSTIAVDSTKCCTKKKAKSLGAYGLTNYSDARLVKYQDLFYGGSASILDTNLVAVFKQNQYTNVDQLYLLVTITVSDGVNNFTKETKIPAINESDSAINNTIYNLPSGYVGIVSQSIGNNTDSHAWTYTIMPSGTVTYPIGTNAPNVVTVSVSVAVYANELNDSTAVLSSDYGSGGGVLVTKMEICERWYYSATSATVDWYYESTFNGYNPASIYWIPSTYSETGEKCIVCFDSATTKNATQNYIF